MRWLLCINPDKYLNHSNLLNGLVLFCNGADFQMNHRNESLWKDGRVRAHVRFVFKIACDESFWMCE